MHKFIHPTIIILFAVALRLVPHPANVTPIAALALFSGAYIEKKYAVVIPLVAMVLSDAVIGFHESVPFVYGCFLFTTILGMWLRKRKTATTILICSITSSVVFFLVTNFGFWLTDSLYPKTFSGQMAAYYFAMPFFRNTLFGDLFFTTLFFGSYELLSNYFRQRTVQVHMIRHK